MHGQVERPVVGTHLEKCPSPDSTPATLALRVWAVDKPHRARCRGEGEINHIFTKWAVNPNSSVPTTFTARRAILRLFRLCFALMYPLFLLRVNDDIFHFGAVIASFLSNSPPALSGRRGLALPQHAQPCLAKPDRSKLPPAAFADSGTGPSAPVRTMPDLTKPSACTPFPKLRNARQRVPATESPCDNLGSLSHAVPRRTRRRRAKMALNSTERLPATDGPCLTRLCHAMPCPTELCRDQPSNARERASPTECTSMPRHTSAHQTLPCQARKCLT